MAEAAKNTTCVNRDRALQAFRSYVSAYDPGNPRIALKVDHTLRVAELCERIAGELALDRADVDLAWLLGLLHDIGRFEQVRRYDTFNDAASVGHAALGVEVLFGGSCNETSGPLIRRFVESDAHDALICTAVGAHSDYRLPASLDERTRLFCDILRDADKLDILRINCTCPIQDIYNVAERDMRESTLSPECVELFYQHRCLPRGVRRFPADVMLGHVCFVWELVFPASLRMAAEQGYLREMLNRTWDDPATQAAFDAMAAHLRECFPEGGFE